MKSQSIIPFFGAFAFSVFPLSAQTVSIPANWSYPSSSADLSQPGFSGKARQARSNVNLSATISRGNDHLRDLIQDTAISAPYENTLAIANSPTDIPGWPGTRPLQPDGSFTVPYINFNSTETGDLPGTDNGLFTFDNGFPDDYFPGFPGETSKGSDDYTNGLNYSVEFLAYVKLPAGTTVLTMRNDDASQLAIHPNDARDIFRTGLIESNTNNPLANRSVTLNVAQEGLYSIRVLLAQWMTTTSLEFFSGSAPNQALVNAPGSEPPVINISNSNGQITLSWTPVDGILEDTDDLAVPFFESFDQSNPQTFSADGTWFYRVSTGPPAGLPSYRAITTPARPYVSDVSPGRSSSGIPVDSNIVITMQNRAGTNPVLRVNGTPQTYTVVDNGTESTLTYDPATNFASGSQINVELDYGSTTSSWSFNTVTGSKAIIISGGGDVGLQSLLAARGYDVTVFPDNTPGATVAAAAADAKVIFNSSTVSSANARPIAVAIRDLTVPIVNVESGNIGDYRLGSTASNVPNGEANTSIVITTTHPATGSLELGTHQILSSKVQNHAFTNLAGGGGTTLGTAPAPSTQRFTLSVAEAGEAYTAGGTYPEGNFPARRVYFGALGDGGADVLTATGVSLFDSVLTWVTSPPAP